MSIRTIKVAGKALPTPQRSHYRKKKKKVEETVSSDDSEERRAKKARRKEREAKKEAKSIKEKESKKKSKKDKKAGTDLVAVVDTQKTITKAGLKFGVSAKEIAKMIDKGDTEKAVGYFQKRLLAATVLLIPIAEKKYKKTGGQSHAYAMNALISTARELAQDLQATGDRQKLAMQVIGDILQPAFRAIAQGIVDEHYSLKKDLEDYCVPKYKLKMKERIDYSGVSMARHARSIYENVSSRTNEALVK